MKFLSKDPEKTLRVVRDALYERIDLLRQCVGPDDEYGDDLKNQMRHEIDFLEHVLDLMELSNELYSKGP